MNNEQREVMETATDMIYIGLFGAGAHELRKRLGLPILDTPNDENLRYHMGLEAVRALSDIETRLADWLSRHPPGSVSEERLYAAVAVFTVALKTKHQQAAREAGRDFLTGKPLDKSRGSRP
mgnify:FL=1